MEHRSYEQMLKGDKKGSGRDHYGLKRICKEAPLTSKTCEERWDAQRFHIRWERLGRSVFWLQRQDFLKDVHYDK